MFNRASNEHLRWMERTVNSLFIYISNVVDLRLIYFSDFKDIFDWKVFKKILEEDVEVVESLPSELTAVKPLVKSPVSWSKVCR